MSEQIYIQVEDAIKRKLYCADGFRNSGGPAWFYPIRIELGNIIMLWGDCGNPNRKRDLQTWTTDKWRDIVSADGTGLYKKTGFWNFTPANDPAADCIRYCNEYPDSAGRELYNLRKEKKNERTTINA